MMKMVAKAEKIHDLVVKVLKELAEEYPRYSKVIAYPKEKEPILIPFEKYTIRYYPDVWAEVKRHRRIDVYEVWHKEGEGEAIADVYLSAKIPRLLNLHIVRVKSRDGVWTKESASNIVSTIFKDLEITYPSLKHTRSYGHVIIAELSQQELDDENRLRESLFTQLEFEVKRKNERETLTDNFCYSSIVPNLPIVPTSSANRKNISLVRTFDYKS